MPALVTPRLRLVPMTLPAVEAVLRHDRQAAEHLVGARFPDAWPNDDLIARAFPYSLDAIRADPDKRLWGDSLIIPLADPPRIIGSVVFHGFPDDGIAEIGYGIEDGSRHLGYATEATRACVDWAFSHEAITAVQATTFPWHHDSLGVIRNLGMTHVATRQHDLLGDLLVFERKR
ncbi:MAG: acetyltransferase [Myxococcales bacterium]|nr:acetyltransferase [Myxococcales bacterium]